jgi:nitrite reductase/ring-hydroxylating ferredoxin subunit
MLHNAPDVSKHAVPVGWIRERCWKRRATRCGWSGTNVGVCPIPRSADFTARVRFAGLNSGAQCSATDLGYESFMLNPEIAANRRPIDRLSRNTCLAAIADRVQPIVARLVGNAPALIRNIVHGTVLGHPLHPAITDIPTGAWTVTAVLDAIELAGGPAISGSDSALIIGLAGGLGAIVTGYADWSDTMEGPRNLGMAHAVLNGTGFTMYLASMALRRGERRRAGLFAGLIGYGFVAAGAYIGGEIAFEQQIGPKHTAEPLAPPNDFTPVLPAAALAANKPLRADFGGIPILLSRTVDGVAAISAVCTHRGAPLDEGTFAAGCIRCPWHGSTFALADGSIRMGPASFPQPRFDARINGDQIEVRAFPV